MIFLGFDIGCTGCKCVAFLQAVRHFVRYKEPVRPNGRFREQYAQKYDEYKEFRRFSFSQSEK